MRYLLVIYALALCCDAHTFTLFDNGASTGGVEVTLDHSEFNFASNAEFAAAMSSYIDVAKYGAENVVAAKAYREDGELVEQYSQLARLGIKPQRRVYLVAHGLEFVWPFVSHGFTQEVSPRVLVGPDGGPVVLESVADSPRVFRVRNMMDRQEAQAIIDNALAMTGDKAMKRSTVGNSVNRDDGAIKEDTGRTSDNTWDHDSPTAKLLIERSFNLTRLKIDSGQQDGLQVVRYLKGQGYNTHPDYFEKSKELGDDEFDFNPYSGGSNRFATVFMYLNDVEEGGFTAFPRAETLNPREPPEGALDNFSPSSWEYALTKQCYNRLAVPPIAATAALFYSSLPDGRIDPMSYHGACPVTKGVKWGCNIWLWNRQRFGDTKTGASLPLLVTNETPRRVYVSWEGKPSGVWQPGQSSQMGTFEHHRFQAHYEAAAVNAKRGPPFATFTVQEGDANQHWRIVDDESDAEAHDEL